MLILRNRAHSRPDVVGLQFHRPNILKKKYRPTQLQSINNNNTIRVKEMKKKNKKKRKFKVMYVCMRDGIRFL